MQSFDGFIEGMPAPYYAHNGITIYNADNRSVLPLLGKFDLCLTDPPYGILGGSKSIGGSKPISGSNMVEAKKHDLQWDCEPVSADMVRLIRDKSSDQVIWGWNHFSDLLPPTKSVVVWDKKCKNGWKDTFSDAELAWSSRGKCTMYRHLWVGALRKGQRFGHPTEKPVELMRFCLGLFPDAKTVVDPFMGTGASLVAAKDLGLQAVGIELNEAYCEISARRLSQEVLPF